MKICPHCNSQAFDDMDTCFVCMSPLDEAEPVQAQKDSENASESEGVPAEQEICLSESVEDGDDRTLKGTQDESAGAAEFLAPDNHALQQLEREFAELRQEIQGIKELLAAFSIQASASCAQSKVAASQGWEAEAPSKVNPCPKAGLSLIVDNEPLQDALHEGACGTEVDRGTQKCIEQETAKSEFSSGVSCILPDYLLRNLGLSDSYQLYLSVKPRK